jgi:hypothetical protein
VLCFSHAKPSIQHVSILLHAINFNSICILIHIEFIDVRIYLPESGNCSCKQFSSVDFCCSCPLGFSCNSSLKSREAPRHLATCLRCFTSFLSLFLFLSKRRGWGKIRSYTRLPCRFDPVLVHTCATLMSDTSDEQTLPPLFQFSCDFSRTERTSSKGG